MLSTPRSLQREDQTPAHQWQLTDIFADWDAWESAFADVEAGIVELSALQGTLAQGALALRHVLDRSARLDESSERVYWYPALASDQDTRSNDVAAKKQRAALLLNRIRAANAWVQPEILALGQTLVTVWLDSDAGLALYRFLLEELFRQHEHVLDASGEQLLALAAPHGEAVKEAFGALSTADMRLPAISLASGESLQLTHQRYHTVLHTSHVQEDRRAAFLALYGEFARSLNTFAALYQGVCQRDWFYARARNYESTLAAALDDKAVPTEVVTNLIDATFAAAEPLRRYYRLRQRHSGLKSVHLYDGSFPIVEFDYRIGYEEAVDHVVASVAMLGEDYQCTMRKAFDARWIDVYENDGKRSGAYSAPVYGVHPYMLMNYDDTLSDMFTLAHEMGHSMHTVLSHARQPYIYAHYTIFVAEVASTLNEALLLDHLLEAVKEPRERIALLQRAIDSIAGTFYTQVLFAAYELDAHRRVEADQPLTAEILDEIYFARLQALYADAVVLDPEHRHTWARIPHFYRSPFYVYQYATCYASAAHLMESLRSEGAPARDRYLKLLASGGSARPMDQLRVAGVDLAKPQTVGAVPRRMDLLIDQLELALRALD